MNDPAVVCGFQTTGDLSYNVQRPFLFESAGLDQLAQVFADANLPLSTDLMTGLPGITPEAFDRDLQRYFDADVTTKAYPTELLPNSPMADPEYIEKYQIRLLLFNGFHRLTAIAAGANNLDILKFIQTYF